MYLILVESPTKSKTLKGFLGKKYQVLATMGHIRDLPKSELGIDIDKNFEPKYIIPLKARKNVSLLKKEAKKADQIILATDEDREGEAIAYHLAQILNLDGKKSYQRIVFHEITKSAIENALKNPRKIDINLVEAQQTRRLLDRLVGYKLSPFLWKKVVKGLSAGRVQSVVMRLVCEKEKEIAAFVPQEYWQIKANLKKIDENISRQFEALLVKKDGKVIHKLGIKTKKETDKIVKDLDGAEFKVANVVKKEIKRNPLPCFITSSLQQEAWKRFRWPAKFTMRIAQQLYETGKITYHRTDSFNIAEQALLNAKKFILVNYGKNYWPGFFRKYKSKVKGAQEAHEAIRPTQTNQEPKELKTKLEDNQFRLYDLIWRRFISSQMSQAIFDSTVIDIQTTNYTFRTNGQILKFDGFLKIWPIKFEENELPLLKKNEILELMKLLASQHFTQPPARFNEASLIKILEENGIGRPSTYAPILSTIQERNYVEKNEQKKFQPTEIGTVVNDLLSEHFPKIVSLKFTSEMENNLDKIAQGKEKRVSVINCFYQPFAKNLEQKYKEISKKNIAEQTTNKKCPKCGAPLIIKLGRFGKFYACSGFPKCRYTAPLKDPGLGIKCPKCSTGEITEKRTKKGKIFYGCNQWPKCDFALWDKPVNEKCPKCDSLLVGTKKGIKCSNKECDYKLTNE